MGFFSKLAMENAHAIEFIAKLAFNSELLNKSTRKLQFFCIESIITENMVKNHIMGKNNVTKNQNFSINNLSNFFLEINI